MTLTHANVLPQILAQDRAELLKAWMAEHSAASGRKDLAGDEALGEQADEFLIAFEQAVRHGQSDDLQSSNWTRVREILADISRLETKRGLNPSEVATFVFSLKSPLFEAIHKKT